MTVEEIKKSVEMFHQSGRRVKMMHDFEDSIRTDHAHIQGLEQLLEAQLAYFENEDWSQFGAHYVQLRQCEIQVEVNDLKERILLQKKHLADKVKHFDEVFYPMYTERLAIVEKQWEECLSKAKQVSQELAQEAKDETLNAREMKRLERIDYYLADWNALPADEQENVEIQSNYFAVFDNLLPKK